MVLTSANDHRLSIRVDGKPQPKERPRVYRGRAITPPKTVEYEERVANAWRETYGDLSLAGKLQAFLYFGSLYHYKTDIDNLVKSALDGLQRAGAFVNGDEQVYKLTASKFPTTRDEQHTIIVLKFFDYDEDA